MGWGNRWGKFGNKRVQRSGYSFASNLESHVFDLLCLMEKAGEITQIKRQDHVYLTRARICYIADFKVMDTKTNTNYWVEAKGFETPEWKIKKRLWVYYGPGILHIYRGSTKKLIGPEVITVKEIKNEDR